MWKHVKLLIIMEPIISVACCMHLTLENESDNYIFLRFFYCFFLTRFHGIYIHIIYKANIEYCVMLYVAELVS